MNLKISQINFLIPAKAEGIRFYNELIANSTFYDNMGLFAERQSSVVGGQFTCRRGSSGLLFCGGDSSEKAGKKLLGYRDIFRGDSGGKLIETALGRFFFA